MLDDPKVVAYLEARAQVDDPVVREMQARAAKEDFPIVGPQVGRLLEVLTLTSGARRVFELGSGFGYSAYWFARGVGPEGRVVLTDRSEERMAQAREYLDRAGLGGRVHTTPGDALKVLEEQGGTWDIVFNDVDKAAYPRVAALAHRVLRDGGLLITDNMLWSGRVASPAPDDAATAGVLELTRILYETGDWTTTLLPVRDGVTVSVKC